MHLKSLGKLKTSAFYRTASPWGCCPPKHERGLPTPVFSVAETVFRDFALCQGAFVPWSLLRPLCPSSLHLPLLQIASPAAQPSQILRCFSEDPESMAEVRPCCLDNELLWTYKQTVWERFSFTMVTGGAGLVEGKGEWWSLLWGQARGQESRGYQVFPLARRARPPAAA